MRFFRLPRALRRTRFGRRFGRMTLLGRVLVAGVVAFVLFLAVVPALSILLLRWVPPLTTSIMLQSRIAAAFSHDPAYEFGYRWTPWDKIAPEAAVAVIASEDQKFPTHRGFDVQAIEDALDAHERGRRLRGASTISQQVAKNLFLWPGRSFVRKGLEAWLTVLLEFLWPKHRILEVYLNTAEMGPGTFGVGAASRRFFGKPAADLTTEEAALLAAVLPNPKRLHADRPTDYVRRRAGWIRQQMGRLGGREILAGMR